MDDGAASRRAGGRRVGAGRLPAEFGCIGCGYVLGSTRVRIGEACVECGRVVDEIDLVSWEARERILARLHKCARLWGLGFVLLLALVAGIGVLAGGAGSAAWAVGIVALVVGLSVVMGWLETRGALPTLRSAWLWVWIENLWMMHMVWLAPAVVGVPVILAVGAMGDGALREVVGISAVVVWMMGSVVMLAKWDQRLARVPLATPRMFVLSTMVMLFPNLFAAAMMGSMAVGAAEEVARWWGAG